MPLAAVTDEANGSQSGLKASLSISKLDVLSANELLNSVRWAVLVNIFINSIFIIISQQSWKR